MICHGEARSLVQSELSLGPDALLTTLQIPLLFCV